MYKLRNVFSPVSEQTRSYPPALDIQRWLWRLPSHNHNILVSIEVLINDEAACCGKVMNCRLRRSCITLLMSRSCIFMQKSTVNFFAESVTCQQILLEFQATIVNYETKFSTAGKILCQMLCLMTVIYRFIGCDWQFAILASKYIILVSMRISLILCRYNDEPPLLPMKKNKSEQVFPC